MKKMKMKMKIAVVLLLTAALSPILVQGQKALTEGKVVYTITYPEMDMDEKTMAMMPTESVVFFKGVMSRTDLDVGMGITSSTILNAKTGALISLTDMMGTKSAVKSTTDEIIKSNANPKKPQPVVKLSDETKVVMGYTCKKALVNTSDKNEYVSYYTDKISSAAAATMEWKEIKGFPLEYYMNLNWLKMKFTATKISEELVPETAFTIPADYKLVTKEEMSKMMIGGE